MKKGKTLVQTRNSVPEKKKRNEIKGLLQDRLGDSIDLMLKARQAWLNANEAKSRDLQTLFDKVYSDTGAYVDLIAERIDRLGGDEPGAIRSATARSGLLDYPLDFSHSHKDEPDLAFAIACYSELICGSWVRTAELGDTDTAEIFARISHSAARNLWFTSRRERPESQSSRSRVGLRASCSQSDRPKNH